MNSTNAAGIGWLDHPGAHDRIQKLEHEGELTPQQAEACRFFTEHGYLVVKGLVPDALVTPAAQATMDILTTNRGRPRTDMASQVTDRYRDLECLRAIMVHAPLLAWGDLLLGARALPYQSLSLPESSQQAAHSDEILMSSEPRGGMIAAWVALEDVHADAGPLLVWPGSHRWDYVSAASIGVTPNASQQERSQLFDANYYASVRALAERRGARGEPQLLQRGDVLFWHQALVHGANLIERAGATRNSFVIHYYAEGARHYSDIWGRPCTLPGLR